MNRIEMLLSYVEKSIKHKKIWESEWNRNNVLELSTAQSNVLSLINKRGPLQSKDLVNMTSITSGGVTMICDKLLLRELIHRIRNEEQDRRAVYLEITDKGRETVEIMNTMRERMLVNIFSVLTDTEVVMLNRIYDKLVEEKL